MANDQKMKTFKFKEIFRSAANRAATASGSVWAFTLAVLVVLVWAVTGHLFHYSDTWQLIINTGTNIVTFFMVFLIQHAQNRDTLAIQLKLNELIAAMEGASNRLIDIEALSEEELNSLQRCFGKLAKHAKGFAPGTQMTVEVEQD